eukprot:NODE_6948_length_825_cov_37.514245_g6348_i0.p1 GENE.NODE_6948_length_825_cov_37.514245_g6348_i0~~NODE_6948_length_825_cov_37.514245_g6348_i0.p1  ORF type:complete len:241 (-),score=36.37 NODE_6948_length_825_cov_37.514245_g6348_i0:101-790(-)
MTKQSVPRLRDRESNSTIGNSDHALRYLFSELSTTNLNVLSLLSRNPTTIHWEEKLNQFGHAIQLYCYSILLSVGTSSKHAKSAWGVYEPKVPLIQRIPLSLFAPVIIFNVRKKLQLTNKVVVDWSRNTINDVLQKVDDQLSSQSYITGNHLTYIDITFASLAAPLIPSIINSGLYAKGMFTGLKTDLNTYPAELQTLSDHISARPCGKFVKELYTKRSLPYNMYVMTK